MEDYRRARQNNIPGKTPDDPLNLSLDKSNFMGEIERIFSTAKKDALAGLEDMFPELVESSNARRGAEAAQRNSNVDEAIQILRDQKNR